MSQLLDASIPGVIISPAQEKTQFYRSVANPAVATGYAFANLPGGNANLVAFYFQLVTDANAANRLVHLKLYADAVGTNLFYHTVAQVTQPASITGDYTAFNGVPSFAPPAFPAGTQVTYIPLGGNILHYTGTFMIKITVDNMQVGDQLQNLIVTTQS